MTPDTAYATPERKVARVRLRKRSKDVDVHFYVTAETVTHKTNCSPAIRTDCNPHNARDN